jgi:hypothetical protein
MAPSLAARCRCGGGRIAWLNTSRRARHVFVPAVALRVDFDCSSNHLYGVPCFDDLGYDVESSGVRISPVDDDVGVDKWFAEFDGNAVEAHAAVLWVRPSADLAHI